MTVPVGTKYGKHMRKGKAKHPPRKIKGMPLKEIIANCRAREEQALLDKESKWEAEKGRVSRNDPRLVKWALDKIRRDPSWWFEHFVYTSDSHDDENRIKKFPMDKPYFKPILDVIQKDKIVIIIKSRQLMMSWMLSCLAVWKAIFFEYSELYVQCLGEKKVDKFIQKRMQPTYDNLPEWQKKPNTTFSFCKMDITGNGSVVSGLPSGKAKGRGDVPSGFVSDELAFQEEGQEAAMAIMPAIAGDSYFVACTTPNMKNFVYSITHPTGIRLLETIYPIPESPKTVIKRYRGYTVVFLHYTADPEKRSQEWYEDERAKFFAMGKSEEAWQQEYEMSFEMSGKPKLFNNYDISIHEQEIAYDPMRPIIRGWDFQARASTVFLQENHLGQIIVLDALMGTDTDIADWATYILGFCEANFKPAKGKDGKEFKIQYRDYCDPSGDYKNPAGPNCVQILRKQFKIFPRFRNSKPVTRATIITNRLRIREIGGKMLPGMIINTATPSGTHLVREGFRGGFCSKPDAMGLSTGTPFKDNYYEHVLDGLGYPMDCLYGVVKAPKDLAREEMAREHRRMRQTQYSRVTGYSVAAV